MRVFGDGLEERMAALDLEFRLRRDPNVTARRKAYETAVKRAKEHACNMSKTAMIDALVRENPAYIRSLLETEDDRFGQGALAERYARTFWSNFTVMP